MGQYKVKNYAPKNYVESDVLKRIKKHGYDVSEVNDEYINQFQTDFNQYINDYESNAQVYGDAARKADDEYNSRAIELKTRAKKIQVYLQQNKSDIDQDTYKQFSKYLDGVNKSITSANKFNWERANINSKYATQTDYNIGIMNSGLSGFDNEVAEARKSAYDYSTSRLTELEELIEQEKDKEKKKSLKAEKKKLKDAINKYKRISEVYDDYSGFRNKKDYRKTSKNRDYKNTRFEDVYDKGTGSFKGEYNIDDPLGYYKSEDSYNVEKTYNANRDSNMADYWTERKFGDYLSYRVKGQTEYWDELTNDEEEMYYYILDEQGKEKALEFLERLAPQLGMRHNSDLYDKVKNSDGWEKVLYNAESIPASLFGGVGDLVTNARDWLTKGEINPYSYGHSLSNYSQAIRGATADSLTELTNGKSILGFTAGDLYQTLMSTADSAVTAMMGNGGLALLGLRASGSKAKELWEQGASATQIIALSAVAGAAEALAEKTSLDKLIKNVGSAKGLKQLLTTVLKQAGVEASEEVFSSAINAVADSMVRGTQSDIGQNVQRYIKDGFGENEAKSKAFWDFVQDDIWKSALGGIISGGLMGGATNIPSAIAGTYQSYQNGKNIIADNGTVRLYTLAKEQVANQDVGKRLSKSLDKAADNVFNNENSRNVGKLSGLVEDAQNKIDVKAIRDELVLGGFSKMQAKNLADIVYKSISGDSLTEEEKDDLRKATNSKDESKRKTISTMLDESISSNSKAVKTIADNNREYLNARYGLELPAQEEIKAKTENADEIRETDVSESKQTENITFDNKVKSVFDVSDNEGTISKQTGETIEISNVSKVDNTNNDLVLKLKDGNTIKASDVSFANNDEAYLYSAVAEMGVSVEASNMLISGYDGSVPIVNYVNGMKEAYVYGYNHYALKDLPINTFLADLPDNLKARGLEAGRIDSINAKKQAENAKKKIVSSKNKTQSKGKYVNNTDSTSKELDMLYEALAKKTGIDIEKVKSIRGGTANAEYILNSVKILIASDANSEITDNVHELGHFVKHFANEEYENVARAMFEWYIDKYGYSDYSDAIEHFKNREGLSYSDAVEEFTNESLAGIFAKEGGAEDFVEWLTDSSGYTKTEQKNILQKFVDLLKDIIDTLKDVIKNGKLSVTAQKSVQMETEKAQEIRRMFLEAIDRASENSNKKTATEGEVKYSLKGDFSDSILKENKIKVASMSPVANLTGTEFQKGDVDLTTQVSRYFDSIGNVVHSKYGDIILNKAGVKSSIAHGIGRNKAVAFKAVADVIENGEIVDYQNNWKGRGYDTAVIAAPISIDNEQYYMAAVIRVEKENNSYYLHEIVMKNKEDNAAFKTGTIGKDRTPSATSSSVYSLLQDLINVNTKKIKRSLKDDEYLKLAERPEENKEKLQQMVDEKARKAMSDSKIVNENGDLLLVYHGTSEDFTVFDKTKGRANMDIQGMFFSPWEIDARGYGEKVGKYYLNIINPASESIGYKTLNKFKGENNAGIKAREYLESLGYDGVNNGNEEFIAFNSKQIKSADPVTYDNDGNVIPLSERFNEDEVDIRYSIKSDKPYNDYSKALTSDEWKKYNSAMTTGVDAGLRINDHSMLVECEKGDYSYKLVIYDNTFEEKPIRAVYGIGNDSYSETTIHEVAKYITGMEDNGYGRSFIIKRLSSYAKMYEIVLGRYSGQTFRYTKYRGLNKAREADNSIRGNTQEGSDRERVSSGDQEAEKYSIRDEADVEFSSIIDTSSPRYILSEALKGTTLNAAERENIEKYQQNIEELDRQEQKLRELKSQIKDISFSSGKRDVQKLKTLKEDATKTENRINNYDKKLTEIESMKLIQDVIEREKSKIKAREKAKAKEGIQKYRERSAERERQIREQYRESRQKAMIRRKETGYRGRIRKIRTELEKELLRPTDTRYVPNNLASSMVDVCKLISFDTDNDSKAQARRDDINSALSRLKLHYDSLKSSSDTDLSSEYDENISEMIKTLATSVKGERIADMNLVQLRAVHDILTEINETLKDARRQIGFDEYVTNAERGIAIIEEQQNLKGVNGKGAEFLNKYVDYSLNTIRAVRRMVNYNADSQLLQLFNELNNGQRKADKFVMEAHKMFEPLTTGTNQKKFYDAKTKVVDFGDGIKMTKMMAMQYILTWEREEHSNGTLSHLRSSGANIADITLLIKGKIKEAIDGLHSTHYHLTEEQVRGLYDKLDDWDKQYLDTSRQFFNVLAKNSINETTRVLKHRDIATSDYYIPYAIDQDSLITEINDTNAIMSTISEMGILKGTVKNAKQSLIFTGLDNVIEKHINDVSKIYGLAIPVRNFNKVWNFGVDINDTVKKNVGLKWGKDGQKLIEQAVKDLQGNRPASDTFEALQKVNNAFVSSALMYNVSVALKQAASLMVANNVLEGRYYTSPELIGSFFATAAKYKQITAEIDEHTATHWRRRKGLSLQELGDMATSKGKFAQAVDKIPAPMNGMKWIQYIDCVTTATFWKMCKADVVKLNPNVEIGSDEYWKLVTDKYDRLIEETQPMYDVLHRPEVLKTKNIVAKQAFAMFKTQPLQNAGMLYDSYGEWKVTGTKQARNRFYRTVASQMASAVVLALATLAGGALRHTLKRYKKDDEDEASVGSVLSRVGLDSFESIVGILIPIGGSQIFDFIENAYDTVVNGEKFFKDEEIFSVPSIEFLNNIFTNINKLFDASNWSDSEKIFTTLGNVLTDGFHLLGVPAKNIKNLSHGIIDNIKDLINGEYTGFGTDANNTAPNVYKLVSKGEDYDEACTTVVAYLIGEGKSKSEAENTARSQLVKEVGDDYIEGVLDEYEAREMLENYTQLTDDQIESKFREWKFKIDYGFSYSNIDEEYRKGNIDMQTMIDAISEIEEVNRSEAEIIAEYYDYKTDATDPLTKQQYIEWYDELRDTGIDPDVYSEYLDKAKACKGTDSDGDGKADSGSVKKEKLEVINSLPITNSQKDALYYINGWTDSRIYEAPWH